MRAYRYRLPLRKPLNINGHCLTHREGVLLEEDGQWAEAAPLPGFSSETIEDVVEGLRGQQAPPPALQFALDTLRHPIRQDFEVPVNALLQGDREEVISTADRLGNSRIKAVKLKVGRATMDDEVELVKTVRRRLRDDTKLRLDANQAWNLREATHFVQAIGVDSIEYIEEPLRAPSELEELFGRTGVRYALDETLTCESMNVSDFPNATAYVCKPTMLGACGCIADLLRYQKPIVLSACFESGVGIARVAQLAHGFSPGVPCGLDTYTWFAEDVLATPLQTFEGGLCIPEQLVVDERSLERL